MAYATNAVRHAGADTPEYIRRAEKSLADDARRDILNYLASHPKAGDLMEGTGGMPKLRGSQDAKETGRRWAEVPRFILPGKAKKAPIPV